MHAIATMVDRPARPTRRARPGVGQRRLRHQARLRRVLDRPPADGFRHDDPQAEIDALPRRELAEPGRAAGPATIEAYTVMHSRDGAPETAIAACLLADGRRAWGMSSDADLAAAMCEGEWVGRRASRSTADGTLLDLTGADSADRNASPSTRRAMPWSGQLSARYGVGQRRVRRPVTRLGSDGDRHDAESRTPPPPHRRSPATCEPDGDARSSGWSGSRSGAASTSHAAPSSSTCVAASAPAASSAAQRPSRTAGERARAVVDDHVALARQLGRASRRRGRRLPPATAREATTSRPDGVDGSAR